MSIWQVLRTDRGRFRSTSFAAGCSLAYSFCGTVWIFPLSFRGFVFFLLSLGAVAFPSLSACCSVPPLGGAAFSFSSVWCCFLVSSLFGWCCVSKWFCLCVCCIVHVCEFVLVRASSCVCQFCFVVVFLCFCLLRACSAF